jgi:hypothetical protein
LNYENRKLVEHATNSLGYPLQSSTERTVLLWELTKTPLYLSFIPIKQHEQSKNVVNLWFHLFSDILGNDQLTEKLSNALYPVLGTKEYEEIRIRTNLPEKNTQRVQRRKIRTGK